MAMPMQRRTDAARRTPFPRRPLRIYLFDPLRRPGLPTLVTATVDGAPLSSGPRDARLEVVDYDATRGVYHPPVDLETREALLNGGVDPDERDPRFHQQMVYAVAARTLEQVDRALGRRLRFRRGQPLRILPHAFEEANAYYDRDLHALLFGYFRADRDEPGRNLAGQTVFTCLSHDIVAHETMHAVIDRLRPSLFEATNEDCGALHEGLSDAVAILQHFTHHEVVRDALRTQGGRLDVAGALVELAQQFGEGLGYGGPLRTSIAAADRRLLVRTREEHDRGAIFLAAVLAAFFRVQAERARPLLRVATGGTGVLPAGDLSPDLAEMLARDAAHVAQRLLTICLRAFDHLPPVDITFGDYLRALVSADRQLFPNDEGGFCDALIDTFLARGIEPRGAFSSSVASVAWEAAPDLPRLDPAVLGELLQHELRGASPGAALDPEDAAAVESTARGAAEEPKRKAAFAMAAHAWAVRNAEKLQLSDPELTPIWVASFHPALRLDQDGRARVELVAQLVQTRKDPATLARFGGLPLRGGCTVIFDADGAARHVIAKPLDDALDENEARAIGVERVRRIEEHVGAADETDAGLAFLAPDSERYRERAARRGQLRRIHARRSGAERRGGAR
jgi:hypothetical protein